MWQGILVLLLLAVAHCHDYALYGEPGDCFVIGFENLKHDEAFSDENVQQFVSSFHRALSLELKKDTLPAFQEYMALYQHPSSGLLPLLSIKNTLEEGCDCLIAKSGKKSKEKKKKAKKTKEPKDYSACDISFAFYFLGMHFKNLPNMEAAQECFQIAVQINPNFGEAQANLGVILMTQGRPQEALPSLQRAIEINPSKFYSHYYLASALTALHRMAEAITFFDQSLLKCKTPQDEFTVLLGYSTALHKSGRQYWTLAEGLYNRAIKLASTISDQAKYQIMSNYGIFLKDKGEHDKAIETLREVVNTDPEDCGNRRNLAHALEARRANGDIEETLQHFASPGCESDTTAKCEAFLARQKLCAWNEAQNWTREIESITEIIRTSDPMCITPSMSVFSEFSDPQILLEIARNYADEAEGHVQDSDKHTHENLPSDGVRDFLEYLHRVHTGGAGEKQKTKRIKIGYISSYFYKHIVGFILEAVLPLHDRAIFEVFAYALNPKDDDKPDTTRESIAASVENFVDVSMMDHPTIAERIVDDEVLVLINMDGHMPGMPHEVLALNPAPVQISFLGFPGSTGSKYTQYIVADEDIIPPSSDYWQYYTEKVIYMPHSYLPTQHATVHKDVTRTVTPKGDEPFIFCSLNQLIKLDPTTFQKWQNMLSKVPNSRLWLQKHPSDAVSHLVTAANGNTRIDFLDRNSTIKEYLEQIQKCDLFLDPLKYNSHTTGADSLWMGVPLLTMPGKQFASRVGAGLIKALACKLPDGRDLVDILVAPDLDSYENRAVEIASDKVLLKNIKESLAGCVESSPLFNLENWVRGWESAIAEVAYKFASKTKPDHVFVSQFTKQKTN